MCPICFTYYYKSHFHKNYSSHKIIFNNFHCIDISIFISAISAFKAEQDFHQVRYDSKGREKEQKTTLSREYDLSKDMEMGSMSASPYGAEIWKIIKAKGYGGLKGRIRP